MLHVALGRSGLTLPRVVFGAWGIGGWAWGGAGQAADERALAALEAAFEVGCDAVDTAPIYGFGHSEELVGRALARWRERADARPVRVLTKVGLRWDDPRGELSFRTAGPTGAPLTVYRNSRPDAVRVEVERSLARLGVERLDLVQVHWRDTTTPAEETLGELARLREEGKLTAIGVSNYTTEDLAAAQRALADVPLASTQPCYSLVVRDIELDVLPWARANEVGVLAYSPLEQGLLTGKVGPRRRFPPGDARAKRTSFRPANRRKVISALESSVAPVATRLGASWAQVVLAWTLAQAGISAVIAGARSPEQARENARAASLELAAEELAAIAATFADLRLDLAPSRVARLRRWLAARVRA